MQKQNLRLAVVGGGAIGGVTAARLRQAGWDPVLVCKHEAIVDAVTSPGIRVDDNAGVPVRAVATIMELPHPMDVVLLATKAADSVAAARELLPFLHDNTLVVSLQNGIVEDHLADVLGRGRVTGCVVGWSANHQGPGIFAMTAEGEFIIGHLDHRPDERLPALKELLDAVQPTRLSDNIMGELFSKLLINACINSLAVLTGATVGEMLARRPVRKAFLAIIREGMTVARAMDIRIEPMTGGKLDYYRFMAGNGHLKEGFRHLMLRFLGLKYARVKPSSLQALLRGRPTEIEHLNGYLCEQAEKYEVAAPVNQAIVRMIGEIERGKREKVFSNVSSLNI